LGRVHGFLLTPSREAMDQEYDALLANNTRTLWPKPAAHHLARNKWCTN